jgi:dihydropteroate synthase
MTNLRVEDTNFSCKGMLKIGEKLIDLSTPKVMGIVNCTPDSFYASSQKQHLNAVLQEVEKHLATGASFIDIGGYSSRPDAKEVSEQEELERVIPIIAEVAKTFPSAILSVDTFRGNVAKQAIEHGAGIINDISGFALDETMFRTLEQYQVPYILMHMRGTPQTMQQQTSYSNLFNEVCYYFSEKIKLLKQIGTYDIILDPGFGFAKTIEQNYDLLNRLDDLKTVFNQPILAGLSRKSMIYKKLNYTPEEALNGSTVLNTIAIQKGASILRVHDVKEAVEIIKLITEN